MTDKEISYSYIGCRRDCGCIIAAVVDMGDTDTAKDVAGFIRDGLVVERVTSQYVRDNMRHCPHGKPIVVQPELLCRGEK